MITIFENPDIEYRNEYDLFVDVYYKGKPFTGKIVTSTHPIEETNYVNGNADGEYIVRYENGSIKEQEIYKKGDFVNGVCFYPNGKKMWESSKDFSISWNMQGIIVSKFQDGKHSEYYSSGELKSFSDKNSSEPWQTKYYIKTGELIYTQMKDKFINGKTERIILYDDKLMYDNYFELLVFENPELKESIGFIEDNRIYHIWMWFWQVFEKNSNKYFDIVNQLIKHPNNYVLETIADIIALHKFHKYIDTENNYNKKAYELILKKTEFHDMREPEREIKIVRL